jgi:hypothetical protein
MTERTLTQLLAGVIDLTPTGAPPHPPGPCTALCVPACTSDRPGRRPPIGGPVKEERPVAPVGRTRAD